MDIDESWKKSLLPIGATIQDAIRCLNETGLQIAIVISGNDIFQGTVTDGDIRRGLLRGVKLENTVDEILNPDAVVIPPSMNREIALHVMEANRLNQLPIVSKDQQVVGLYSWNKFINSPERQNTIVIMAGGLGYRLRPHTSSCPKPMLQVGGKPILEHIITRAKQEGFKNFVLAIRYLGHMIEEYFGNGEAWGIHIEYLREDKPLGTAGALSLLQHTNNQPLLVTNSDVLSDIKFAKLLDYHVRQNATATMAVRLHELQHPFGVVRVDGLNIVGFEEKPMYRSNINAGVYVIEPSGLDVITKDEHCDMPVLFERLIQGNQRVLAYPMHEAWLDIGKPDDYEMVIRDYESTEFEEMI